MNAPNAAAYNDSYKLCQKDGDAIPALVAVLNLAAVSFNCYAKSSCRKDMRIMTDIIDIILFCPLCHARHIDKGEFETKPHHTHACQQCGFCWRPAVVHTRGVEFLPGFRDEKCVVTHCQENPVYSSIYDGSHEKICKSHYDRLGIPQKKEWIGVSPAT